jgi:hypothetical protein
VGTVPEIGGDVQYCKRCHPLILAFFHTQNSTAVLHRFVKEGVKKRKKHAQASGLAWVSMEKEPNMKVDHACVKKKYLR